MTLILDLSNFQSFILIGYLFDSFRQSWVISFSAITVHCFISLPIVILTLS